jgi:hypothetical protein
MCAGLLGRGVIGGEGKIQNGTRREIHIQNNALEIVIQ